MGCKKPSRTGLWTFVPDFDQPTTLQMSDNVECYGARAGTPDGHAGAKDDKPDIITTYTIPIDCEMNVDTVFNVSGPRVPTGWYRHTTPDGDGISDPAAGISGVAFVNNITTARFYGTFDPFVRGRRFEFYVTAKDATGRIDTRHYILVPQVCEKSSDIKFIHPLPGSTRTSVFGPRKRPCEKCSDMHKGVDFAFGGGKVDDVQASADGDVVFAGVQRGYGNIVIMTHKNGAGKVMAESRYAHLERIYVSVGQKIAAGTKVGREGNTGVGTGKHLHFEIRVAGKPVNPEDYINGTVKMAKAGEMDETYNSNDPPSQQVKKSDPGTPTGPETTKTTSNVALTASKAESYESGCPPERMDPVPTPAPSPSETAPVMAIGSVSGPCAQKPDPLYPNVAALTAAVDGVLNSYPLDAYDKSYIKFTMQIESTCNRFATNKTETNPKGSSATGLYQFLDELVYAYYGGDGEPVKSKPGAKYNRKRPPGYAAPAVLANVPPTCENRCSAIYATHAMVAFYLAEVKKYYDNWVASGKTKIAGIRVDQSSPHIQNLQNATKAEFCYAVHHEGPSVLAQGRTSEGINYFRRRAKQYNFTS